MKPRLDEELVAQGFFDTTQQAAAAVMAGDVSTNSERLVHPGARVKPGLFLHVKKKINFVSRGGLKLERALEAFCINPRGRVCLDIGASTGGFTDCLLRGGAQHVTSVDVGYAQFSWQLRCDSRVTLYERTNICELPRLYPSLAFDLIVCDVSFTSIGTIIDAVRALCAPNATFVTLIKPQFETPKELVEKGGVVREPQLHTNAIVRVIAMCTNAGFDVRGVCNSPIHGAKGNSEFLLCCTASAEHCGTSLISDEDISRVVHAAHAE